MKYNKLTAFLLTFATLISAFACINSLCRAINAAMLAHNQNDSTDTFAYHSTLFATVSMPDYPLH